MMPILFKLPILNRDIPGYGLMLTLGFLLAIWWAARRAQRSGANPDVVLNCGFIALFCGVIGCRAMYVYHYWSEQFAIYPDFWTRFWKVIDLTKGGLEFYGGFVLSIIVVVFYLWRWGHSVRWYMDIVAPSAALGAALGRVGCFLNGCCWGGPCDLPWAVEFPYGSNPALVQWERRIPGAELPQQLIFTYPYGMTTPISRTSIEAPDAEIAAAQQRDAALEQQVEALEKQLAQTADAAVKKEIESKLSRLKDDYRAAKLEHLDIRVQMSRYGMTAAQLRALAHEHPSLAIHPTQLYSTAGLLLLALMLNALYWVRTRDGQVICTLLAVEPVSRWLLEIIRADNPVDTYVGTVSQMIALGLTLAGVAGLIVLRRMPPRAASAKIFDPEEAEAAEKQKAKG